MKEITICIYRKVHHLLVWSRMCQKWEADRRVYLEF